MMTPFSAPFRDRSSESGSSLIGSLVGIALLGIAAAMIFSALSLKAKLRGNARIGEGAGSLRAVMIEQIGAVVEDAYRRDQCSHWDEWFGNRASQMSLQGTRPFRLIRQTSSNISLPKRLEAAVRAACEEPRYLISPSEPDMTLCLLIKADPKASSEFLRRKDSLVVINAKAVDALTGVPQGCGAVLRRPSVLIDVTAAVFWQTGAIGTAGPGGKDFLKTSFMVSK